MLLGCVRDGQRDAHQAFRWYPRIENLLVYRFDLVDRKTRAFSTQPLNIFFADGDFLETNLQWPTIETTIDAQERDFSANLTTDRVL